MAMNRILIAAAAIASVALAGCTDASVASRNLSQDADNFRIVRKISAINGITDRVMLEVVGKCSIEPDALGAKLDITCKLEDGSYVKHFVGISDNVTYTVEQLVGADVSVAQYRFTIKPSALIPSLDVR